MFGLKCMLIAVAIWALTAVIITYNWSIHDTMNQAIIMKQAIIAIMFRLESEKNNFYVNRTIDSLKKFNWDYQIINAVNGRNMSKQDTVEFISNLHFAQDSDLGRSKLFADNLWKLRRGEMGVWLSHLSAWDQAWQLKRPIISLESDTVAVADWNDFVDTDFIFEEYDILFAHYYQAQSERCRERNDTKIEVIESMDHWYGCGAMLFTGRRSPKEFADALFDKEFNIQIDHWLNKMYNDKVLKIGKVCPPLFHLIQDHESTIRG